MLAEILIGALMRAELAGSAGVLLVLLLRPWIRWRIGPQLAYRLWLIPVVASVASLFPTMIRFESAFGGASAALYHALSAVPMRLAWGVGALATASVFARAELGFRRLEQERRAGPAVVGIWPRLVVPHDYAERFSDAERRLIRRHERAHMRRRDPVANLFLALASVAFWFNPLVHIARRAIRLDQELACDALALEDPGLSRRAYGEALLKAQLQGSGSWLACGWSGVAGHPLELRVRLLSLKRPSLKRDLIGASAVSLLAFAVVVLVLFLDPAPPSLPAFPWRDALQL
jgi:beta-lactamase regulating signal transducer with metallopeptidase domain